MTLHIAIDIGGTQLRAACYSSEHLTPLAIARTPTQAETGSPLQRLQDLIASIWPASEPVAAMAVAAPGPVDPYQGLVLATPNIAGWNNLPLRDLLQERFHVPVALGNDANLAALGEWKFGAGQGHHNLVYLTISTGIGGGVIINDQLLLGTRGLAGELGHVTVVADGPVCGCGMRGHLEAVASGTGILHWVRDQLAGGANSSLRHKRVLTTKAIAEAAEAGDSLACEAFERAGTFLGVAVADYLHIFNPTIVVFGGGVTRSGDLLLKPVRLALPKHVLTPVYLENLTLATAALGDEAGLMGALALARSFV